MFCSILVLIIASTLFFGKEEVFSQRRYDDQYNVRVVISPIVGEDEEIARANADAITEIVNAEARRGFDFVSLTSANNILYIVTGRSR